MSNNSKRVAVGIDLGTTYSALAHVDDYGKAAIVPNAESERITPSVILFDGNNAIVGTIAKQSAVAEPENVVQYIKREMGRPGEAYRKEFAGTVYSAEELSAMIIKKLKRDAERYVDKEITDAVITVPAYFTDAQRTATLHAGQIAGFNVLSIINEPTAAALAYGLDRLHSNETVFVFDLGGGTFDVTIMRIKDQGIEMLATNGDGYLGGKDWDQKLIDMVANNFKEKFGDDPRENLETSQDLANRALGAKVQLSSRPRTTIVLSHNGRSHKVQVSREEFEDISKPLVSRCRECCEQVMREAGLTWKQLDKILLVGGMTRMPMIREMLEKLTGMQLTDSVNPDEAVAVGAAVQAVLCLLEEQKATGKKLVDDATRDQFTTKEGALMEITTIASHTLGVVIWNKQDGREEVFPMIKKGTKLPCEVTNRFGTSKPDMRQVTIRVAEGEKTDPKGCSPLGAAFIELPEKLPQGTPISVTYRYDANQILEVIAKVEGREVTTKINRNAGLSDTELDKAKMNFSRIQVS